MEIQIILLFGLQFVIFLFSVIIHEISHGFVAEALGDSTARDAGRLTLNPLKHLDWFGSVLLPILLALTGLPVFGWANPVPYNPMNLKNPRRGAGLIAFAGPASNFLIAIIFGLLVRFVPLGLTLSYAFQTIVYSNVILGVFNMVPIPPLDGSKVLFAILPLWGPIFSAVRFLERYGTMILILFILFGFRLITPVIDVIANLIIYGRFM